MPIQSCEDVDQTTRVVRTFASNFGFNALDANMIASATSELAMNMILHAGQGVTKLAPTGNGHGVEISFIDEGPGIANIDKACVPGYSSRPDGLGLGLPAAKNAVDHFEISTQAGRGTVVTIRHYRPPANERFDVGIASSADPLYACNGDVVFSKVVEGDKYLLAVIDGMGQGELARDAALVARRALESSSSINPLTLASEAHEAVLASAGERGFAMALMLVSVAAIHLVNVGDVACRVFRAEDGCELTQFIERPGTLGTSQPVRFVEQHADIRSADMPILIMLASDGISTRFSTTGNPIREASIDIADLVINDFRRAHGDATVVILRINR